MAKPKTYKVKALVNIKYDKTPIKAGKEFKVRKEDALDLNEKGYIILLEEIKDDNYPGENRDDDSSGEEGEN